MALRLSIENEINLPDGGPLSITATETGGIDIGRDPYLGWTLPDPSRTISGKHCEVRFENGDYWLHDLSTNGTFVNGSDRRLQGPHRLRTGDRIEIGHYIISVTLDDEEACDLEGQSAEASHNVDLWDSSASEAAPLPREEFQPGRPVNSDFLDWAADIPQSSRERREPFGRSDLQMPDPHGTGWAARSLAQPDDPGPIKPGPGSRPPEHATARDDHWGLPLPARRDRNEPSARPATTAPTDLPPLPRDEELDAGALTSEVDLLQRFARGAGISKEVIAWRDPGDLAELLGELMRVIAEDLKQLLMARAESKRLARSTNQTTVQAVDNNPLKFSPTSEDSLRLMFGKPSNGYLDARQTLEQSFRDLKIHQVKTYAAIRHALRLLIEDLDPQAIDEATDHDGGLVAMMVSRKSRLWDTYVTRWQAKCAPHEDGFVDAFMLHFADCYDRTPKSHADEQSTTRGAG